MKIIINKMHHALQVQITCHIHRYVYVPITSGFLTPFFSSKYYITVLYKYTNFQSN